jgi:ferredoxin/flavodoxin---NADP+ reductase
MVYDIIVIGAGPAGLTAGANAANRGLKTLILEGQHKPGGQPRNFYPKKVIIDYPGFPKGITGKALMQRLYDQALESKVEIKFNEPMISLDLKSEIKKITTKNEIYKTKKVILCTGLHNIPRQPEYLKDYQGKNVKYYVKNPAKFKDKNIIIIGGGDTAFDRANMLSKYTKSITILVREKTTKAQEQSVKIAKEHGIEIMYETELLTINQDLTGAELIYREKKIFHIPFDYIIVSIGYISSLDVLVNAGLKKDQHGMIKVDLNMETSIEGVFAAGDLVGDVKLISVACAEGIIAAVKTFNEIKKPYWLNK